MSLEQRPSAPDRTGMMINLHLWGTVVLGLMATAGMAEGQGARRTKKTIDARQAVRIAERFVRENGYTDFIPDDSRRLVPESIEFARDRRALLEQRHRSLKPKAVGYRKGGRNDPRGWTVGFALVKPIDSERPVGRAVTMDARGRNIRVQHMGFFLGGLEPRPD